MVVQGRKGKERLRGRLVAQEVHGHPHAILENSLVLPPLLALQLLSNTSGKQQHGSCC